MVDLSTSQGGAAVPEPLRELLNRLIERQSSLRADPASDRALSDAPATLRLADAVLRTLSGPASFPQVRPAQFAILGPTQTGKSTVVNLLLGSVYAGVSPLAGFTVHPHGFWVGERSSVPPADWLSASFRGFTRVAAGELSRERLAQYALTPVSINGELTAQQPYVLWDAPDFDSLAANTYQDAVLELLALADAHVFVLSKEKYSDLSVWRVLRLIHPLRRPLLIVLNKLTADSVDVIVRSVRSRLEELDPALAATPIVPIEYHPGITAAQCVEAPAVRSAVRELLARHALEGFEERNRTRSDGLRRLIRANWDAWLDPVRVEHATLDSWRSESDAGLDQFMRAYQRDYLDHPQRYDSFRRASVELLNLLEVPKIGNALAQVRQIVTWPMRQLFSAGRSWLDAQRAADATAPPRKLTAEATVLIEAIDVLLSTLQRDLLRHAAESSPAAGYWRTIGQQLEENAPRLRDEFSQAIQLHHERVTREVHTTADRLFEELRKHPAKLAALRTARAALDVGALLMAVKTGGLGPIDLVWAPATFAFSSFLMEGLAGMQMGYIARDLKNRQHEAVRRELVDQVLAPALRTLGTAIGDGSSSVSPALVLRSSTALDDWDRDAAERDLSHPRVDSPPSPPAVEVLA